ncbi:SDR family oxidoreductase [Thiothrix litoralis]|jgi:NAD(P)-dependent dehydrogenase (short-subunit alcohol dehydrogenase family)|uniref:SDR family oxidoreductase n=1 Tax=Thiothrix litoralis TaxID=2891210 RepID=A0ABX7WP69_9GAMM|nr:SDR family oxidoreductase [Thiothrix litoralis]QTR45624.1 SDR family oxidoreductase [Thiothrix litoralis]
MPTILITGANRGIGLELTRQYAADGWNVLACCRSPENAHDLNKLVAQSGGKVSIHLLDVASDAQRASLAAQLKDQPIDILFNSAGVSGNWGTQGFGHCQTQEWLDVLHINVITPMLMMQDFADNVALSEHKIIANMSSKMGSVADNTSGGSYLYRSSKAALNMVNKSAAHDLARKGITVVALHPGWVRTDMGGPNGELSTEESVTSLKRNLANVTLADSGNLLDIDGSIIPW